MGSRTEYFCNLCDSEFQNWTLFKFVLKGKDLVPAAKGGSGDIHVCKMCANTLAEAANPKTTTTVTDISVGDAALPA
jgi:hypothetical protein